jgi:hypothetical protein
MGVVLAWRQGMKQMTTVFKSILEAKGCGKGCYNGYTHKTKHGCGNRGIDIHHAKRPTRGG